jgi:hypothetical protein
MSALHAAGKNDFGKEKKKKEKKKKRKKNALVIRFYNILPLS